MPNAIHTTKTETKDYAEVIFTLAGGRDRIRIKDILYHFRSPNGKSWREEIPRLWDLFEEDIIKEIRRIRTRGKGKITVSLPLDGNVRLRESIRLVAYHSLGYSAVPYDVDEETK